MKKIYFSMLTAILLFIAPKLFAQELVLKQVFVGSGGSYSDPDDFVELSSYNPASELSYAFGTVFTQSVQDVIVHGDYLYVAAQDSLVKYSALTYSRLAVAEAVGVNKLTVVGDNLIASFTYPVTEKFVRVFSADDLSFIGSFDEVSDEAAHLLVVEDVLYVAVPGGWTSTSGKIAMIDLNEMSLLREVDLGAQAVGIYNLFSYNNQIVSVNLSPWGATSGFVSVINKVLSEKTHYEFQHTVSKAAGIHGHALYLGIDGGIGEIDLTTMTLTNAAVVAPPDLPVAAAVFDTVNANFYLTTTDYATQGHGLVYNLEGQLITTFAAGISAEAIALDYRLSSGMGETMEALALSAFPNPARERCVVRLPDALQGGNWSLVAMQGATVISGDISENQAELNLEMSTLPRGMYVLNVYGKTSYGLVKIVVN